MKIALLGDIALFGTNTVENSNWREKFAPVKAILGECDYVIGNLESPLTTYDCAIGGKSAYLKGSPDDVEILKYIGITHVTLANNHMYDYCQRGLEDTLKVLDDNGIVWYGVKGKQARIMTPEREVALLGYCCYSTNGKGMGIVNILDPEQIEKELDGVGDAYPIVSLHWGQEHVHYPNYDHIEVARKLCANRSITIHGHHPHAIQGIEGVGNSVVAYSLGNFCFDDVYTKKSKAPLIKLSRDNQESFVMVMDFDESKPIYHIVPFSFEGGMYREDRTIEERLNSWSAALEIDKEEYKTKRQVDLERYLTKRKSSRTIEWYLRRMNVESVKMIIASSQNSKKYAKLIKKYIQ